MNTSQLTTNMESCKICYQRCKMAMKFDSELYNQKKSILENLNLPVLGLVTYNPTDNSYKFECDRFRDTR